MTSFLFLLCLYPSSSFFYESAGKERKGEVGKKPPAVFQQHSGKTRQDKKTESLSFPPSLAQLCRIEADKKARRTGAQKEAHLRLPSFCSFIPSLSHCCQKRRSKEKRRREARNEEGFGKGGGTLFRLSLPSYAFHLSGGSFHNLDL